MRHIVAIKGNGGEMTKDKNDRRRQSLSQGPTVNVSFAAHWNSGAGGPSV